MGRGTRKKLEPTELLDSTSGVPAGASADAQDEAPTEKTRRVNQRLSVEERRRQLIELGKTLFAEHAYDQLATDELARLAGVSTGLLYHYFPSKRDYYIETMRDVARQVLEATDLRLQPPTADVLRQSLAGFVRFVEENQRLYRALVGGGIGSDRTVRDIVQSVRETSAQRILEALHIAQPTPRDVLTAMGFVGFIEIACLRWIDSLELTRDEMVNMLFESVIRFVRPDERLGE